MLKLVIKPPAPVDTCRSSKKGSRLHTTEAFQWLRANTLQIQRKSGDVTQAYL